MVVTPAEVVDEAPDDEEEQQEHPGEHEERPEEVQQGPGVGEQHRVHLPLCPVGPVSRRRTYPRLLRRRWMDPPQPWRPRRRGFTHPSYGGCTIGVMTSTTVTTTGSELLDSRALFGDWEALRRARPPRRLRLHAGAARPQLGHRRRPDRAGGVAVGRLDRAWGRPGHRPARGRPSVPWPCATPSPMPATGRSSAIPASTGSRSPPRWPT